MGPTPAFESNMELLKLKQRSINFELQKTENNRKQNIQQEIESPLIIQRLPDYSMNRDYFDQRMGDLKRPANHQFWPHLSQRVYLLRKRVKLHQ